MEKINSSASTESELQKQPSGYHSGSSHWKHMLLMFLGCLVPVGASLVLTQMGYTGIGSFLLFLLCPIMHLFMMRKIDKERKSEIDRNRR